MHKSCGHRQARNTERKRYMKYQELNASQRKHMKSQCSSGMHFDWEERNVLDVFLGALPQLRQTNGNDSCQALIWELEKTYRSYNAYMTDADTFLNVLRKMVSDIQAVQPNWYGVDFYAVEQRMKMHRFCLVSGEGGIGKSFFVMELEEALAKQNIPHLCIYGKLLKDIDRVDFDEIAAQRQFVFVVDALNEMSLHGQQALLEQIKRLKSNRGCRIIVTYRTHRIPQNLLEQYKAVAEFEYEFQGVSFESALDCLIRQEIPNVHLYEDILYSNNPLYLTILAKTLSAEKMANREVNHELNSLTSITNIFEQYIKKTLDTKTWQKTKILAEWMYQNNTRKIKLATLETLIDSGRQFFEEMQQRGFMSTYQSEGNAYCFFSIETLSDFLIARTLMNKLPKDDPEGQIALLKEKLEAFPSLSEAFILILFDLFTPDYKHIRYLMERSELLDSFREETLLKVIFSSGNIALFQKEFRLTDPLSCFETFAGYTNQPFNCTNYMNTILLDKGAQLRLSSILEGKRFHGPILSRLKNILYTLNTITTTPLRLEEAYWFALWCCAAPHNKIRKLATKLLFDVVYSHPEYRLTMISLFPQIYDHYIQDAIIFVLSTCPDDENIRHFFEGLINDSSFLLARSLKRIAQYIGTPYGYIEWNKINIRDNTYAVPEVIESLTAHIDLVDQYFLPFRWHGHNRIEMQSSFLDVNKCEITEWNALLNQQFACITQSSDCCGSLLFEKKTEVLFGREYSNKGLAAEAYYKTMAKVVDKLLHLYPVRMKEERYIYGELASSLIRKCFDIANDMVLGSFMCNYYSNQFGTYNNKQDCLGYEVYDPLEYEELFPVATPLPNYSSDIEILNDIVAARVEIPLVRDTAWVKDIELTRKNLAALQLPISYQNHEWIMIAGRINWRESDEHHNTQWEDTYLLWCCTSAETSLVGDGNERYLTIELEDYISAIGKYAQSMDNPHLCKSIPSLGSSDFDMLDESGLILPPAELVRNLSLTINTKNMTLVNPDNEVVMLCDNVKYSYYTSTVGRTIFMRKDIYEEYIKNNTLKFFVFTERYHPDTGRVDETSKHFEIEGGVIRQELFNRSSSKELLRQAPSNDCCNCPHGFYVPPSDMQNPLKRFLVSFEDDLADD